MWLLLLFVVGSVASVAAWRFAFANWEIETPRQAVETAWFKLNPPRAVTVGALQQRIMRAAVGARVVSVRGVALVPSTFEVRLHSEDLDAIEGVQQWIASELGEALAERAEHEGWQLQGRPVVVFLPDDTRPLGRPEVRARHEPSTVALGAPAPVAEAALDLTPGPGWLRPLGDEDPIGLTGQEPIVLGRGAAAGVDLQDPAVSRRHCEVRPVQGGWVLADLGSANGTEVNGVRLVGATELQVGDTVVLGGRVRFQVEALDPSTRVAPPTESMPQTRVVSGRPA